MGISWVRQHGGVPALTLAKAVITSLAVFLLITARRRSWPVWTMILAWLPAATGSQRPDVCPTRDPEPVLPVDLPRGDLPLGPFSPLAWLLPLVQLAWVNTHGLFVLGPIVVAFAFVRCRPSPRRLAHERIRWWRTIVPACVATGLACLLNPYGLRGAIYPLELAGTMRDPIFSRSIAELTPIPLFIEKSGLTSLPLQLHLVTMFLGALSFLGALCWAITVRLQGSKSDSVPADKSALPKAREVVSGQTEESRGSSRCRRGRRRLAAQSIPVVVVRCFQRAQPSGHAQQPPVRSGCRLDHRLELRRVGRRPAAPCGAAIRRASGPAD